MRVGVCVGLRGFIHSGEENEERVVGRVGVGVGL